MSYLLSLTGLSRFADAEERERRKAKDARAEEEQRINRLWNSLINPAPKPFGRIGRALAPISFHFPRALTAPRSIRRNKRRVRHAIRQDWCGPRR